MKEKVGFILFIIILIFIADFILAEPIGESLHVNIQTTNSTGVATGTFKFEFNISTSTDCSDPLYSNYSTLTTDSRGIISYYLENVVLNYSDQYWLCYYRDGILINNSKIVRTPYTFRARNMTSSGLEIDSDLNLGNYNLTIGGGWLNNGVSILGGDIFAKVLYVYNISSLNVNNLVINGSSFPSFDDLFDIGNSTMRWQDLFLSGQVYSNGTGNNYFLGNLGIGTSNPSQKLEVNGSLNVTGNLTLGQKITFAFGEVIDNLVDGWVTITGGLRVEGKGNFSGTIYINNGTDVATLGGGSSTNLTDYYRVYDTGWINRSDWTNVKLGSNAAGNVDSNVTHNLGVPLSNLTVKVLISTGGAVNDSADLDAHSFILDFTTQDAATNWYGSAILQVDNNNILIQTATSGLVSIQSNGVPASITTQNYWYKVIVTNVVALNSTPLFGGTPAGAIMAFNLSSCPTGWILADGTSGTPDLRGIFVRGAGTNSILNYSNGSLGGFSAIFGTYRNDSFQGHVHDYYWTGTGAGDYGKVMHGSSAQSFQISVSSPTTDGTNGVPRTGAETTPAYHALIYCMKTTEDTVTSNTIWGESGSNVFVQNTSRNVGIGTTSPSAKLEVNGTFKTPGMWVPIETQVLTTNVSNFIFTNISSDFKMLKLVYFVNHNRSEGGQVRLIINSDTAANYRSYFKSIWTALDYGEDNVAWIYMAHMGYDDTIGWGIGEVIISDVADQYKKVSGTTSDLTSTNLYLGMSTAIWKNNVDSIQNLTIQASDGSVSTAFDKGSRITLMGMY